MYTILCLSIMTNAMQCLRCTPQLYQILTKRREHMMLYLLNLIVHVYYPLGRSQEIAVTRSDQGSQLLAIVLDVLAELLLEFPYHRQRILKSILPVTQSSGIWRLLGSHCDREAFDAS